uniref:NADH-ubiquinone oxidoreductase chain 4 n=1 Tax=Alloxysta sp. ZJUH_2016001 TaxID=2491149 RepID=A0A3Q8U9T3_9HYME|nr:NADH dehydrogenase subunit 4 [Alloxysta sp. ZJUH_2016001]
MMIYIYMSFSLLFINMVNYNLIMLYMQNLIFILVLMMIFYNNIMFMLMKFFWLLFMDYYSFYLIILSMWILSLMFMSMIKIDFIKLYSINLMLLLMILSLSFMSMNYFMFYFFFEISMIPTLILVIGWGKQFERIEAGIYMLMYTLFASLPLMMMLLKIYYNMHNLNMILLNNLNMIMMWYMYIYMMLAFLVKMPMFFFHLWLPKAHVEASITGSMILAGIMLKLGSYGLLRIMLIMEFMCIEYNYLIISFSLVGSLYISLVCLQQSDMKMLIAYSSVVHMGLLLSSLMTMSSWGYKGGLLMMISHGLCSSGLFCLINIYYVRLSSRSILLNKGMMNLFPSLGLYWFILSIFNSAAPPSLNLFSEIMMINSLMMWSMQLLLLLMILSFMSFVYMMFFYSLIQHGKLFKNINNNLFINMREYLLISLHGAPLLFLIMFF